MVPNNSEVGAVGISVVGAPAAAEGTTGLCAVEGVGSAMVGSVSTTTAGVLSFFALGFLKTQKHKERY